VQPLPKPKRGRKLFDPENLVYDNDGEVDFESTLENEIGNRAAPPLPWNPPPGPKWQAKQGIARLNLNGAEYAVLACLIDRASKCKGACFPSQEFICGWTSRPKRTVERAVATLEECRLIQIIDRGLKSNAYVIDWQPIFVAYQEMKAFEKRNALRHAIVPKVAAQAQTVPPEVAALVPPEVAAKPIKRTYEVKEPMTLNEASGDAAYLVVLEGGKKEGNQEREVESVLTYLPPHEGPSDSELGNIVSGYCEPFHWANLTEEDFEAAVVAERRESGAGRAVVHELALQRATEKGTANG
jgi:Helix-turn-helix domain